jgi:SAM-dependent MidA family methyltransferase
LARQVAECWERLGRPVPFTVREAGAGRGTLARDIIDGLRQEWADGLAALRYELADANAARVEQAVARLAAAGADVAPAGDEPITGVLLANELLDAFPVHRLIVHDGTLHELYVTWRDGWFTDEVAPLSDPALAQPVEDLPFVEGQRLEVSPAAQAWARGIGGQIERGYAILIDYGYPAEELYAARERFGGTLRTYSRHLAGDDPYRRVGRQDLTAHVDVTAVERAAVRAGLDHLGTTTQAAFLLGLGLEDLLREAREAPGTTLEAQLALRAAIARLLDPAATGVFRVLVFGRELPIEPPLRGLAYRLPSTGRG